MTFREVRLDKLLMKDMVTPMSSASPIRMRDASQTTLNDEKYI
jgi:hypothetical protein